MCFGLWPGCKSKPLTSSLELCVRVCLRRVIHNPANGNTHAGSHTMFPSRAVKIVPDKKRRKGKYAKMTWNEMGNGAALLFCARWVDFTVI